MSVSNSIVDFFQGNPFNNPVGSNIEKATDFKNGSENWNLYMDTCDIINKTEDGPNLAIRAIKRRLSTDLSKNKTSILYTLTLLETCVKNCGKKFHLVVCSKDFLQDLEKIVLSLTISNQKKHDVPIIIRDRILLLIQTWYDSFRGNPSFHEIEITYKYLRESGLEFPMTDLSAMSPINTPKRSVSSPKGPLKTKSQSKLVPVKDNKTENQTQSLQTNFVDKLSKDLTLVQINIDVLGELMRDYPAQCDIPDEAICLMKNLETSCQEMQSRLLALINRWDEIDTKDSVALFDLLRVNDEMNSVITQYERYERTRTSKVVVNVPEIALVERISKSRVTDVYAAQQEVTDYYEGFSRVKAPSLSKDRPKSDYTPGVENSKLVALNENNVTTKSSSTASLYNKDTRIKENVGNLAASRAPESSSSKRVRNDQDDFQL